MEIDPRNNSLASATWSDVPDDRLKNLINKSDHFEIKGRVTSDSNSNELISDVTAKGGDNAPGLLQRAYRAASRNQSQKDEYRSGMENVRALLREKYDNNAVARFDNHFAYRRWAGKPLTVRAFKVFIQKEEELRQGSVNVSTEKKEVKKLEDLRDKLSVQDKKEWRIIGGSKVPSTAKTDYTFRFLPIKRSWFEFSANAEDFKKGHEAGIDEARAIILELIPNPTTKGHVEHLFNSHFAAKIEKKETLTVKELSSFIDDAIKIRDNENKILGGLYSAGLTARDAGVDVTTAVCNFLKGAYHGLGVAAGAAVVANAEAGVNDPITALVKGVTAGGLVAAETDTERIMTAVAEHFVATPAAAPAPQTSITSSVLKFFTFGIY